MLYACIMRLPVSPEGNSIGFHGSKSWDECVLLARVSIDE